MISRIDHVAIAVRDYEKAREFFTEILGAIPGSYAEDHNAMKYLWRNYALGDLSRLELLTPTGPGSFLEGFLAKREGVHHITLETPDIEAASRRLKERGIPFFDYHDYGPAWKELFIHPRDAFGVLIQIAQFTPDDWLAEEARMPRGRRWHIEAVDEGCDVTFAHPGGGRVRLSLGREEAGELLRDLQAALQDPA